jgi:hypothetical protein
MDAWFADNVLARLIVAEKLRGTYRQGRVRLERGLRFSVRPLLRNVLSMFL